MPGSTTAIEQTITGWSVGIGETAFCQRCKADLGEGSEVTVYAYRCAGEQLVSVARLYCTGCERHEIQHPAQGCYEWLADARLALTADIAHQSHGLILENVQVIDHCGPTEGDER